MMKKCSLIAVLVMAVLLFACSTDDKREEEFVQQIEALENTSTVRISYIHPESVEEMLSVVKTNLIIRCKVTGREETVLHNPYDRAEKLTKETAEWIATPYTLAVTQVILGEFEGETITYYAPYGILGEYANRRTEYPIFRVGEEYILFLRAEYINNRWEYSMAHPLYSLYKVNSEENRGIFAEFSSADELADHIRALAEENEYDLTPAVVYTP